MAVIKKVKLATLYIMHQILVAVAIKTRNKNKNKKFYFSPKLVDGSMHHNGNNMFTVLTQYWSKWNTDLLHNFTALFEKLQ